MLIGQAQLTILQDNKYQLYYRIFENEKKKKTIKRSQFSSRNNYF